MSVFNASRLLNKTVVITGASAGIGAVRGNIERVHARPLIVSPGHRAPLLQSDRQP
jgi:NADPH-dependent curcumin reductase CurA